MKRLTVSAVLICVVAAYGVSESVWALVATDSYIQEWAAIIGTAAPGSALLTLVVQFFGVFHMVALVALAVVALIPLRRAEKWAWYTLAILGGFAMAWVAALWASHFPIVYIPVALGIAALALSAQPVFGKKD